MVSISIIVPVYNVSQYLRRCIDSILAQSFKDFELILIDDGSTDDSGRICDEYASKDSRVFALHKQNGGVSSARNAGLNHAHGDWVAFVDSDDWLERNYLAIFLKQITSVTDLVLQSFWNHWENTEKTTAVILPTREIHGNYRLVQWLEETPGVHNGFIWHRLFKRALIEKEHIRFAEDIHFAEDGWFFFRYLKNAQYFNLTSEAGYHYIIRKGSLTSTGKTVPVCVHGKVLRGYITSLCSFEVAKEYESQFIDFVHRYAWRLVETWFFQRKLGNDFETKESLSIIQQLCSEFDLHNLHHAPLTLRCLVKVFLLKDFRLKVLCLRIIVFIRKYEQKIKRHL